MKSLRSVAGVAMLIALAACSAQPPLSNPPTNMGAGVGFGDYATYMRAQQELSRLRAAEGGRSGAGGQAQGATTATGPATGPATGQSAQGQTQGSIGAQAVAAVRGDAFGAQGSQSWQDQQMSQPVSSTTGPVSAGGAAPLSAFGSGGGVDGAGQAPASGAAVAVSDQTFEPRPFGLPHQNEIHQRDHVPQVQVNEAAGDAQVPNLFTYALSTRHNVGQQMYQRSHPMRWRRSERACAEFRTTDLAQEAFLAAGGPAEDPQHLDPDGDGFACGWDPAQYRTAARTAQN